jgi:hypothetical protein
MIVVPIRCVCGRWHMPGDERQYCPACGEPLRPVVIEADTPVVIDVRDAA